MNEESRELIKQLLQHNGGVSLDIFEAIHEEHRKREHKIAKVTQPTATDLITLRNYCRIPLSETDRAQQGFDYLCLIVQDCLDDGDEVDFLYALVRVWRKAWALQAHLGPIER